VVGGGGTARRDKQESIRSEVRSDDSSEGVLGRY
jgi:hypothetical protein